MKFSELKVWEGFRRKDGNKSFLFLKLPSGTTDLPYDGDLGFTKFNTVTLLPKKRFGELSVWGDYNEVEKVDVSIRAKSTRKVAGTGRGYCAPRSVHRIGGAASTKKMSKFSDTIGTQNDVA